MMNSNHKMRKLPIKFKITSQTPMMIVQVQVAETLMLKILTSWNNKNSFKIYYKKLIQINILK